MTYETDTHLGWVDNVIGVATGLADVGTSAYGNIAQIREMQKQGKLSRKQAQAQIKAIEAQTRATEAQIGHIGDSRKQNEKLTRWMVLGTVGVASAIALMGF